MEDFELVTDEQTGGTVLRLKADAVHRKGLSSLEKTNFEVVIDPKTGDRIIRVKNDGLNQTKGRVEIVTDAITWKQTIRMIFDDDDDNEESNEGKFDCESFKMIR
jgi:hypothetical protein